MANSLRNLARTGVLLSTVELSTGRIMGLLLIGVKAFYKPKTMKDKSNESKKAIIPNSNTAIGEAMAIFLPSLLEKGMKNIEAMNKPMAIEVNMALPKS